MMHISVNVLRSSKTVTEGHEFQRGNGCTDVVPKIRVASRRQAPMPIEHVGGTQLVSRRAMVSSTGLLAASLVYSSENGHAAIAGIDGEENQTFTSVSYRLSDRKEGRTSSNTVLLLGGTGRVGGLVLARLLERGNTVVAIVRSESSLKPEIRNHPRLTIEVANVLEMSVKRMADYLRGCDAAVSCLGHPLSLDGLFEEPRRLCRDAVALICTATASIQFPAEKRAPLKLVLLGSAGVDNPDGVTDRYVRGWPEQAFKAALVAALPPYQDNIEAAQYLARESPSTCRADISVQEQKGRVVEWVVMRPDTFLEGPASDYVASQRLHNGLFDAGVTTMANTASFASDLVSDDEVWATWRCSMPQVLDATQPQYDMMDSTFSKL
eukprot:1189920-Prorocentrum_minimum.AAC.3